MTRFNLAGYRDTIGGWIDVVALLALFTGGRWRLTGGGGGDWVVLGDDPPADWSLDWTYPTQASHG